MSRDCAVIVFAKAPVPGRVKTRLAATIGEIPAARLAARMLDRTLKQAVASDIGPVELCCEPDCTHRTFQQAVKRYGIALNLQVEGDLGIRMHCALARVLLSHPRALLIGTDCPQLGSEHLRQAASMLRDRPAVFIPSLDGGYVLVGLSAAIPEIFKDIDWSTERVMRQTKAHLDRLGIISGMLPPLADVDEPDDLTRIPSTWMTGLTTPASQRTCMKVWGPR